MRMFATAAGAAGTAVLAMATALAPPAQASTGECGSGRFCFWTNSSYSSYLGSVDSRGTAWVGSAWNDRASSWVNNTGVRLCVYANASYGGSALRVDPGYPVPYNGALNDRMSSVGSPRVWHQTSTIPGSGYYDCT